MITINSRYRIKTLREFAQEYDVRVLVDKEGTYYDIGHLGTIRDNTLFGAEVVITMTSDFSPNEVCVEFVSGREGEWVFPFAMLVPMITVGMRVQLNSLFDMVTKFEPKVRKHTPKTTWVTMTHLEFELEDGIFFLLKEHASSLLGGMYVVEAVGINLDDNRFGVRIKGVMFPQEFIKGY